ncbi:hypothetical protein FB451DRAFT_1375144 [Mycena latifolia]|nr:hypothetical protein FB451DRAFT_1375144 [Mycena latifolia]
MGGRTGDANRPCNVKTHNAVPGLAPFRLLAQNSNVDWGVPQITGGKRGVRPRFRGRRVIPQKRCTAWWEKGERGLQWRRTRPASNQRLDYDSIAALSTSTDPRDSSEERTRHPVPRFREVPNNLIGMTNHLVASLEQGLEWRPFLWLVLFRKTEELPLPLHDDAGLKTRPLRVARPGQLYRESKPIDSMKTLVDEENWNPETASSASPASFGSSRVGHT